MLRVLGAAGIALGAIAIGAAAQAANNPLVSWQGVATITGLTAQCGVGFSVGDQLHSVYRPKLVGDEPDPGLSLISGRSASSFRKTTNPGVTDDMRGSGTWTGTWVSSRVTGGSGAATKTFNFAISPKTITDAKRPQVVTINGTITGFENTTGCVLNFEGAYELRPD